ncbi:hypothetical protein Bbelb_183050 [Branchiostoma belcheri]|nr:hypothetical protein Bbelb_183050 [Branchiostoma belcheri]
MPLWYQCARFGVKCDFNYSKKKVISQTSILHPNHEIDRTRSQSLETLRAHNPIVINKLSAPTPAVCCYPADKKTPSNDHNKSVNSALRIGQFKTSPEKLPGACRRPTKEADARPTPEPDRDRPGYIPDGHRRAGREKRRSCPLACREKRRSCPLACREKRRSRPLRP